MEFPLIEHGGRGRPLHLAPATGFPLETYFPIIEPLTSRFRVVSIPPRALWPRVGPPPDRPGSWEDLAEDLAAGLAQHRLDDVIAIGHSFGGVASLLAAIRRPARFGAVCLLDPTILIPARMEAFRAAKATGWKTSEHPLAARARDRRSSFRSREEAFRYWRAKRLFADWSDEALGHYVRGMLRPRSDGRYDLAWTGAWESYYYESFYPGTWDDLLRLDSSLPVLVIRGETSDTFPAAAEQLFRERVPWAETAMVSGFGHLFPLAAPQRTLEILVEWLDRVG